MRRFLWAPLLFALALAACSPGGSGFSCNNGICIHLEVAESVKALEPTLVTVTVKTTKDVQGLGISLLSRGAGTIATLSKAPQDARITYQDQVSVDWRIDTKSGEEYVFSAYVVLNQPPASYGIFNYQIGVLASHPRLGIARDSVDVYLDAAGNQIDAEKAREMPTYPLPTPAFTFVPKPTATMTPTPAPPAVTPKPTATPTRIVGYPTLDPAATPTISRDYPEP